MLQLSQGDIIVRGTDEYKVLGVCGNVVAISYSKDQEGFYRFHTPTELERLGWSLKKKKWEPEDGENYWFVNTTFEPSECVSLHTQDRDRFDVGNCFETREQAQAFADKIRALKE